MEFFKKENQEVNRQYRRQSSKTAADSDRQKKNMVELMSDEQRELFAFMESLHSAHVYFLLISQAQCQRNRMSLCSDGSPWLDSKMYLLLTDFSRLIHTLCSRTQVRQVGSQCVLQLYPRWSADLVRLADENIQ